MKHKRLIVSIIIIVLSLIVLLIINLPKNNSNKLNDIKNSLSNVFFYLDKSYINLNDISDYCKISLIYDTNYIEYDYYDYDSSNKKINGYTKNNIINSLKKILGDDITIDLDNLIKDKCMYNDSVINLTYNSRNKTIYTYGTDKSNRTIIINWDNEIKSDNKLELSAKALMIVKNEKYDLYIDSDMEYLIGSYNTLNEAKKGAKDNMNRSYNYEFKLEKIDNNYVWKSFRVDKFDNKIIE